jgi:hypothetical protein
MTQEDEEEVMRLWNQVREKKQQKALEDAAKEGQRTAAGNAEIEQGLYEQLVGDTTKRGAASVRKSQTVPVARDSSKVLSTETSSWPKTVAKVTPTPKPSGKAKSGTSGKAGKSASGKLGEDKSTSTTKAKAGKAKAGFEPFDEDLVGDMLDVTSFKWLAKSPTFTVVWSKAGSLQEKASLYSIKGPHGRMFADFVEGTLHGHESDDLD